MANSGGRWVSVRFPDGRVRSDWIPAEQPPSPSGQRGFWHVVHVGAHQPPRWEWHADPGHADPRHSDPRRAEPRHADPPPAMPAVRPQATVEVLPDRVYRPKRTMGLWFWLAAVILAAIGGAGAVAVTRDQRASASLTADARPVKGKADDSGVKPTKAELTTVATGYLNALLRGDINELLSYLDPSCNGADPGFALAARWAKQFAAGATVAVNEVEVRGRRGSVTNFSLTGLDGPAADVVRHLISDESPNGEQSFPWRFTGSQWYFKGECGSPVITTPDESTTAAPTGG